MHTRSFHVAFYVGAVDLGSVGGFDTRRAVNRALIYARSKGADRVSIRFGSEHYTARWNGRIWKRETP